jgi:NADPH-dependent curcumin reductase CurA
VGAVGLTAYFGLTDAGQPRGRDAAGDRRGGRGRFDGRPDRQDHGPARDRHCGRRGKMPPSGEDYGFDVAIDYKGKSQAKIAAEIADAAPQGVDILFENVGGDVMDAAMLNLALHARVVLCGLISEYNSAEKSACATCGR